MKTFPSMVLLICLPVWIMAQGIIPDIGLRKLDGRIVSSDEIFNISRPVVMIFWKSHDPKCCDNLENIQSAWISRLKENGVSLVAICIDCRGNYSYLRPLVNGKEWAFDVYIDYNGDFKRALGVTNSPYTLLFDKNQNLICRHEGYCSGNEDMVCEKILHCIKEAEKDKGFQANAVK